ncbi:LORF8 [Gallid alphaherpesvirus 2]|uniref:23 kDa protein n=2 Tax=Gallid alphaherpesvirus 2 TaxID=10390 RepID=Q19BA1_9ALPH|nr:23 kDa protein [Gallid alphaherpesvirus 2]ACR02864.1 LORF8 [synthetic construct]AEV55026.1 LORF8 [Gallid herpesvirus 2 strain 814]ACF94968.1 LORF8 [Gallid alphaherpesvirus 2]ACR03037.1 LORF8 [synthetic construct]
MVGSIQVDLLSRSLNIFPKEAFVEPNGTIASTNVFALVKSMSLLLCWAHISNASSSVALFPATRMQLYPNPIHSLGHVPDSRDMYENANNDANNNVVAMTNIVKIIPMVHPQHKWGHAVYDRRSRSCSAPLSIIRRRPRTTTKSRSSSGVGDIILIRSCLWSTFVVIFLSNYIRSYLAIVRYACSYSICKIVIDVFVGGGAIRATLLS